MKNKIHAVKWLPSNVYLNSQSMGLPSKDSVLQLRKSYPKTQLAENLRITQVCIRVCASRIHSEGSQEQ